MNAKCEWCDPFNFQFCGTKPPCPDVVDKVEVIGLVFKSKKSKNAFDGNLEAVMQENLPEEEEKFFTLAYSIAQKTELILVTISEFKLLQRVVRLDSGRYKRLSYSDGKFLMVPAHWAGEIRILKKYILRLQSLDLSLDYEFIKEEAENVNLERLLWSDGGFKTKLVEIAKLIF